jgi:pimeloyl-ACP methyl ester carboxylesterase
MTRKFTLEECAGAALVTLDHLGVMAPIDWVGNAWGGHVGILFAAAHPERCRSLVTIGTPVHPLGAGERRRISALVTLYRFFGPIQPLVNAVQRGLLSPRTYATDPDALRLVATAVRQADRPGMRTAMQSVMLSRQDLTSVLPKVTAPSLIVTGGNLPAWTPADARAAAARMPHGTAATVPATRHLIPLEAAATVAGLVTDFWQGLLV